MRALNIVSTAYRATSEEQNDTVIRFVHTARNSGADVELMLTGNSVNYAVRVQDSVPMTGSAAMPANRPRPADGLARFIGQGGNVFCVVEDVAARGIEPGTLIEGVQMVWRASLPVLFERFDRVWTW
jgi:hypothetical protein